MAKPGAALRFVALPVAVVAIQGNGTMVQVTLPPNLPVGFPRIDEHASRPE